MSMIRKQFFITADQNRKLKLGAAATGLAEAELTRAAIDRGLGLDALIAATAEHHGLELVTLNVKHFPMFPKLRPAY